jgi:GTPase SAR1 family protein
LVHEAVLAAKVIENDVATPVFWKFVKTVFEKQEEFFDVNCWNTPRQQIYNRLIELANESGLVTHIDTCN